MSNGITAAVDGTHVAISIADGSDSHQLQLTPMQAVELAEQLAEATSRAIVNGGQELTGILEQRSRVSVSSWSFNTYASPDGRLALVIGPANWICLELELQADGARALGESLISGAEFLEQGSTVN